METKTRITVSEVVRLMTEEGYSRAQVGEHFKLNKSETTALFKHEKLAKLRQRKPLSFEVVDDTVEEVEMNSVAEAIVHATDTAFPHNLAADPVDAQTIDHTDTVGNWSTTNNVNNY